MAGQVRLCNQPPPLCSDGDAQHYHPGAQSLHFISTTFSVSSLEARPWARSGDGEVVKRNPCLQGAYILVGEETSEQAIRKQGGEGMGLLGTQGRPLVPPPELALVVVIDGSFCLLHPVSLPPNNKSRQKPQWRR